MSNGDVTRVGCKRSRVNNDDKPTSQATGDARHLLSPFVISQEERMDVDDTETTTPPTKRFRLSEDKHESPGVVSLVAGRDLATDMEDRPQATSSQPNQWWKQKSSQRPSSDMTSTKNNSQRLSLTCFVCRRTATQPSQGRTDERSGKTKSLLSYFSATPTSSFVSLKEPSQDVDNSMAVCAFCERQACSLCSRRCERCDMQFCSFCSTLDFTTRVERSLCIDCLALEKRSIGDTHGMELDLEIEIEE